MPNCPLTQNDHALRNTDGGMLYLNLLAPGGKVRILILYTKHPALKLEAYICSVLSRVNKICTSDNLVELVFPMGKGYLLKEIKSWLSYRYKPDRCQMLSLTH